MSKGGKGKQRPKDGEDKGKKGEIGKNKDFISGPQAAPEHAGLNQAIQFAYFIDEATNVCNDSKCNSILFLIWVPLHALNLHNRIMIIMKPTRPEAGYYHIF